MIANGRPVGSLPSAAAQDRWERTPDVVSELEATSSAQTYILLAHDDSGELPMEDSSRDDVSDKL
jgi:hypothetical protein